MTFRYLSDLVQSLRLRAEGMQEHPEEMAAAGFGQEQIDQTLAQAVELETLIAEREALKSTLEAMKTQLRAKIKKAIAWRRHISRRIKSAFPDNPDEWLAFGIDADF